MTTFRDKINTLNPPGSDSTLPPDYKRAVWNLLIGVGGVLSPGYSYRGRGSYEVEDHYGLYDFFDTYGNEFPLDQAKTIDILEDIRKHGINYDACSDPAPEMGQGFIDSFTDDYNPCYGMGGILVLNNGFKIWWGVNLDGDHVFGRLVQTVSLELTFEEAFEELEERATGSDPYSFIGSKLTL